MQLESPPGSYEIYSFLVDGADYQLLCDDAQSSMTQAPYQATEDTLSDLSGSLLARDGDANALQDYETIAILDLWALANPSDIEETQEAIWAITQDRAPRESDAAALLSWAQGQDPADYNLSNFVIFATPTYQEQTGFMSAPEPPSWCMAVGGIGLIAWSTSARRRRLPS